MSFVCHQTAHLTHIPLSRRDIPHPGVAGGGWVWPGVDVPGMGIWMFDQGLGRVAGQEVRKARGEPGWSPRASRAWDMLTFLGVYKIERIEHIFGCLQNVSQLYLKIVFCVFSKCYSIGSIHINPFHTNRHDSR